MSLIVPNKDVPSQLEKTLRKAADACGLVVLDKDEFKAELPESQACLLVRSKAGTIPFIFMPQIRVHQAMMVLRHLQMVMTVNHDTVTTSMPDGRSVSQPYTSLNFSRVLCSNIMSLVHWHKVATTPNEA